jgi:ABC-2 type transport system permease protein
VTRTRTILLVAGREVRQRLRSKAFVGVTLVLALLGVVAAVVPAILDARGDDPSAAPQDPPIVGVVGDLPAPAQAAVAATLGALERERLADETAARDALAAERIDLALLDGGARVLVPGAAGPLGPSAPPDLAAALGLARALQDAGLDGEAAGDLITAPPADVEVVLTGTGVDPATGAARFAVAYAGALFLYFVLIFFANLIVTGVIEEKGSRVVEVLLPAVPARDLMAGKVLGLGAVGTMQAVTIVVPGLVALLLVRGTELPPSLGVALTAVIVAFVLGYALYAGVTAGLAALVSRVEDSQVALFPLYTILVGAFLLSFPVLNAPDTTLARVVTFVPFTAPFVVPARIALVDLPLWQAGLAAVGVVVTAVLLTGLAARLFEGSILRSGARVRLRSAWRGARE